MLADLLIADLFIACLFWCFDLGYLFIGCLIAFVLSFVGWFVLWLSKSLGFAAYDDWLIALVVWVLVSMLYCFMCFEVWFWFVLLCYFGLLDLVCFRVLGLITLIVLFGFGVCLFRLECCGLFIFGLVCVLLVLKGGYFALLCFGWIVVYGLLW